MSALAPAQTAPPPPGQGNERLVALLSVDDYPAEAVRQRLQGTVIADLKITKDGRVSDCTIVKSSGHLILDDRTCHIFKKRARFQPAKDQYGQPMEDVFRTPLINWRLGK